MSLVLSFSIARDPLSISVSAHDHERIDRMLSPLSRAVVLWQMHRQAGRTGIREGVENARCTRSSLNRETERTSVFHIVKREGSAVGRGVLQIPGRKIDGGGPIERSWFPENGTENVERRASSEASCCRCRLLRLSYRKRKRPCRRRPPPR